METAQIDLRGLPVWERPAVVVQGLDQLAPGETLTLVTENEPRGLTSHITESRRHQLIISTRRIADAEWHILYTRARFNGEGPLPFNVLHCSVAFSQLPVELISEIASLCQVRTARRGQEIVKAHARWPHVGVVIDGTLALANAADSARQRLYYEIFAYEIFGEAEFFDDSPMLGRVIVLSKTASYLLLPAQELRAVAFAHPELMSGLGRVLAHRSREALTAFSRQATMPIVARIAQALIAYAMPEKGLAPANAPLPHLTQSQIAAAAGTVKEVAARAIAELERMELLKRERGHVCYLDRQGLADFVRSQS